MSLFVQEQIEADKILALGLDNLERVSGAVDLAVLTSILATYPDGTLRTVNRKPFAGVDAPNANITPEMLKRVAREGFILTRPTSFSGKRRDGGSRMRVYLQDYPQLPWVVHFDDIASFDASDRDEVQLHPYDLRKASADIKARIQKRLAKETFPGGIANFPVHLFALRHAIGYANLTNVPLQMLSYYVGLHGDEEPAVMGKGGTEVSRVAFDSVAALRIQVLFNAALYYSAFPSVMTDAWWIEILRFILRDPYYASAKYSSIAGMLVQAACCLAPDTAVSVQYNAIDDNSAFPTYNGHTVRAVPGNDRIFYEAFYDDIRDSLHDMDEISPLTSNLFMDIMKSGPTRDVLLRLMVLRSIPFWVGYGRGQTHLAHLRQYDREELPKVEKHPWEPYIESEIAMAAKWMHEHHKLLNWDELKRVIPHSLKTTAAAVGKVTFSVRVPDEVPFEYGMTNKPIELGGVRSQRGEPKWKKISSSDKKTVVMSGPNKYLTMEEMFRKTTPSDPGTIGSRSVPGPKPPRSIMNIRVGEYLISLVIEQGLNDYINMDSHSSELGTSNDFVAGKDVGPHFVDSFYIYYCTSTGRYLNMAADYKAFDTYQKYDSARVPQIKGWNRAFSELGLTAPLGPIKGGLLELVQRLFGPGIAVDGVALTGRLPLDFFEKYFPGRVPDTLGVAELNSVLEQENIKARFVTIDSLRSGELLTLASNGVNNRANFRSFFDRYGDQLRFLNFKMLKIQGDDSFLAWRIVPGQDITLSRYKYIRDNFISHSLENHLMIKVQKTLLRMYQTEFLQRMSIYGVPVPKLVIQVFGSEKVARTETNVNMMRAYVGKLNSVVSRGVDDILLNRLSMFIWGYKRSMMNVSNRNVDETYYPPFATYCVTMAQGGIGRVPWTTAGANIDTVIADWYYHMSEDDRSVYEHAAGVLDFRDSDLKNRMARLVNSDSEDVYPRDPFREGREFVRSTQIQPRFEEAARVADTLEAKGIKIGRYRYDRFAETFLEDSLSSNKELRMIDMATKALNVRFMIQNAAQQKRSSMFSKYEWVKGFEVNLREPVEPRFPPNPSPIMCQAPNMLSLGTQLGLIQSRDLFRVRPARLLNALRQDPYMRRDIREDSIIELLSDPKVFSDLSLMEDVLVSVGARRDLAAQVAALFMNRHTAFIFKSNISGLSLADSILSSFDLSLERHFDLISLPVIPSNDLSDLLLMHGMAKSIIFGLLDGGLRKVEITEVDAEAVPRALQIMLGGSYLKASKFISFFRPKD